MPIDLEPPKVTRRGYANYVAECDACRQSHLSAEFTVEALGPPIDASIRAVLSSWVESFGWQWVDEEAKSYGEIRDFFVACPDEDCQIAATQVRLGLPIRLARCP